jgi:hypothetical protein
MIEWQLPPDMQRERPHGEGTMYEVWIEGYAATGQRDRARFLGVYTAENFNDAAEMAARLKLGEMNYFNKAVPSFWGCKFYDNEADARRSFG